MKLQTESLPYHYETGADPVSLTNTVTKQTVWQYSVKHYTPAKATSTEAPLLIEKLCLRSVYTLGSDRIGSARVHEWHYNATPNDDADPPFIKRMHGYRLYDDGQMLRDGEPFLQPEVAIALCYTPDAATLPPYIETATADAIKALLDEAVALAADDSAVNSWQPIPIAAPATAPEDVYQVMRQMRGEVGIRATRGRSRMLTRVMEAAGVTLNDDGWALTDAERTRRKQEPIT